MKDNYIVPVHPRPGTETPHELNAPSFYLLDRYLKAKATELFDVAHSQGLPVLQTGRYQNLTYNIKVSSELSILKILKYILGGILDRPKMWPTFIRWPGTFAIAKSVSSKFNLSNQ